MFAMLGLVLLTIGTVSFVDMGLKALVFTMADEEQRLYNVRPPMPIALEKLEKLEGNGEAVFSEQEKTQLKALLAEYKSWEERIEKVDPVTARRHRDASFNLALILIGLPLYFYHWRIIKRETK